MRFEEVGHRQVIAWPRKNVQRMVGRLVVSMLGVLVAQHVVAQTPFTVSPGGNPAVAVDGEGQGVVVFEADDGSDAGVYAQRVALDGTPLGGSFRVNATVADQQRAPAVAYIQSSAFVVVWESLHTYEPQVFGQCFAANGTPLGGEFHVSTTAASRYPTIDVDDQGNFVIAWSGTNQPHKTDKYRPYLRRFTSSGTPLGGSLRIGSNAEANRPGLAVQPDGGDFLVAWRKKNGRLRGQLVDLAGTPLGGSFRIGSKDGGINPKVAVGIDREYTVVWERGSDGGDQDVFVQRVSRSGVPLGGELRVSATSSIDFATPGLTVDEFGNTIVTWHCRLDDDPAHTSVFVRPVDLFGVPLGGELLISPEDGSIHRRPEIKPDGDGGFLVIWERKDSDESSPTVVGDAVEVD